MALLCPLSKSLESAEREYIKMRAYLKFQYGYTDEQFKERDLDAEFLIDMWNGGDGIK